MTYKELMEKCKSQPGFLQKREQREAESQYRFQQWLDSQAGLEEYRGKKQQDKK